MDKKILLKDEEMKTFTNESSALSFLEEQEQQEQWITVPVNDLKTFPLDNAPIVVEEYMKRANIKVSPDSVREAMATTKIALSLPEGGKATGYPVGMTAFLSLIERAGYKASPVLTSLKAKGGQKEIAPMHRAEILNLGLKCFTHDAFVLVRDEKVRAVLSAKAGDYIRLPVKELIRTLKEKIDSYFTDVAFSNCTISHEYTTFSYEVKDINLRTDIQKSFSNAGISLDNFRIIVKLGTSDVGMSGANLFPVIRLNSNELSVGFPVKLSHRDNHSMQNFANNVDTIFASFKEASGKIDRLANVSIKHPYGCLSCIAKKVGLPKKLSLETAEALEAQYGNYTTGLDVFWNLYEILDKYQKTNDVSEYRKMVFNENISRIAFTDISEYDASFCWD